MSAIVISCAGESDCEALAELHAVSFEERWNAEAFRALLSRGGAHAYAARAASSAELMGLLLVQRAADECEILTLATLPQARRTGIASALLRRAAQDACAGGARTIFLDVAETNAAAAALYAKLGFSSIGRRRGYYRQRDGSTVDALLLRADLPLREKPGV